MAKKNKIQEARELLSIQPGNKLTDAEIKFLQGRGIDPDKFLSHKRSLFIFSSDSKAKAKIIYSIAEKLSYPIIRILRHVVSGTGKALPGVVNIPKQIKEGQERGEIATQKDNQHVPKGDKLKTLSDIGISRKESSTFQTIEEINFIPEEAEQEPVKRNYKLSFPSVWADDDFDNDNMRIRTIHEL